jgi:hypothetical protein
MLVSSRIDRPRIRIFVSADEEMPGGRQFHRLQRRNTF